MGNFCTSDDREFSEFSKFFKLNREYIKIEADLTNKSELRSRAFLENFFNKNRDIIVDRMSKIFNKMLKINFRKIQE